MRQLVFVFFFCSANFAPFPNQFKEIRLFKNIIRDLSRNCFQSMEIRKGSSIYHLLILFFNTIESSISLITKYEKYLSLGFFFVSLTGS